MPASTAFDNRTVAVCRADPPGGESGGRLASAASVRPIARKTTMADDAVLANGSDLATQTDQP
jgi:hypothetical protein